MFLLFLCLNKDENVKLFWYSLIITIRGQKRAKMRQKGLLKVPNWKKIIFQLRKYIFLLLSGKNHESIQKQHFPGQPIYLVYI